MLRNLISGIVLLSSVFAMATANQVNTKANPTSKINAMFATSYTKLPFTNWVLSYSDLKKLSPEDRGDYVFSLTVLSSSVEAIQTVTLPYESKTENSSANHKESAPSDVNSKNAKNSFVYGTFINIANAQESALARLSFRALGSSVLKMFSSAERVAILQSKMAATAVSNESAKAIAEVEKTTASVVQESHKTLANVANRQIEMQAEMDTAKATGDNAAISKLAKEQKRKAAELTSEKAAAEKALAEAQAKRSSVIAAEQAKVGDVANLQVRQSLEKDMTKTAGIMKRKLAEAEKMVKDFESLPKEKQTETARKRVTDASEGLRQEWLKLQEANEKLVSKYLAANGSTEAAAKILDDAGIYRPYTERLRETMAKALPKPSVGLLATTVAGSAVTAVTLSQLWSAKRAGTTAEAFTLARSNPGSAWKNFWKKDYCSFGGWDSVKKYSITGQKSWCQRPEQSSNDKCKAADSMFQCSSKSFASKDAGFQKSLCIPTGDLSDISARCQSALAAAVTKYCSDKTKCEIDGAAYAKMAETDQALLAVLQDHNYTAKEMCGTAEKRKANPMCDSLLAHLELLKSHTQEVAVASASRAGSAATAASAPASSASDKSEGPYEGPVFGAPGPGFDPEKQNGSGQH